jgi:N utilization substance protein B
MSGNAARRRSREVALQVLYAADLSRALRPGHAAGAQQTFDEVARNFELPEGARAFAKQLVHGVASALQELDETIARRAQNWRLERMAAVDRNVLRIAVFELLHCDTPLEVVLDEAVELARRFGGDGSPPFVNGILDAIARASRAARESA